MKIIAIDTFLADGGWRPWAFVRVRTDEGLVGYGECTSEMTQYAVLGAVADLTPILLGQDPRAYEMRFWDMYRWSRLGSMGGAVGKAIGAIECALLDIKAKALGISVVELFGGPTRTTVPLYWSHWCINRIVAPELCDRPPIRSLSAVAEAAHEAVERGYRALKTNIFYPGDPPSIDYSGFEGKPGSTDGVISTEALRHCERLFATIRDAIGPDVGLILDLIFNLKPESAVRVARTLAPYDLLWLELDTISPEALLQIKNAVELPICSCENLFYTDQYRPFFERQALDIVMVDTPWMGFAQAKKVGDLAQLHQINVCPHNYYSHLASFISASLCAVLPNVRIMEYDVDDVPWKDELVTEAPLIVDGAMMVPTKPGWGTELDERALSRRAWQGGAVSVTVPTGFALDE